MPDIINWRDANPVISHDSAVVWACLQPIDSVAPLNDQGAPAPVLEQLGVMTVHGIQGRKASDHHKHLHREQVYYIIAGSGEVLCGDTCFSFEAGDALYLPSGLNHQIFNRAEDWVLHHVISMDVESDVGAFKQRNLRDVSPRTDGVDAIRWHLLGRADEPEVGCLHGLAWIDRESVQPRGHTTEHCERAIEQIYYILEGAGTLRIDGHPHGVTEGDMIHIPMGASYTFINTQDTWLSCLIVGG
jgi:mannose-6-phosphate isomerase-like protein (cupin superfamily)